MKWSTRWKIWLKDEISLVASKTRTIYGLVSTNLYRTKSSLWLTSTWSLQMLSTFLLYEQGEIHHNTLLDSYLAPYVTFWGEYKPLWASMVKIMLTVMTFPGSRWEKLPSSKNHLSEKIYWNISLKLQISHQEACFIFCTPYSKL